MGLSLRRIIKQSPPRVNNPTAEVILKISEFLPLLGIRLNILWGFADLITVFNFKESVLITIAASVRKFLARCG